MKKKKTFRGQRKHPKKDCDCFHCTGFDKGLIYDLKIKILENEKAREITTYELQNRKFGTV